MTLLQLGFFGDRIYTLVCGDKPKWTLTYIQKNSSSSLQFGQYLLFETINSILDETIHISIEKFKKHEEQWSGTLVLKILFWFPQYVLERVSKRVPINTFEFGSTLRVNRMTTKRKQQHNKEDYYVLLTLADGFINFQLGWIDFPTDRWTTFITVCRFTSANVICPIIWGVFAGFWFICLRQNEFFWKRAIEFFSNKQLCVHWHIVCMRGRMERKQKSTNYWRNFNELLARPILNREIWSY